LTSRNICRHGDTCSGHACYPPRPNIESCDDVFANGITLHLQGQGWAVHCCKDSCHAGTLARGSRTVFVGGVPVSRIGDPVSCGSAVAKGSVNVFAG